MGHQSGPSLQLLCLCRKSTYAGVNVGTIPFSHGDDHFQVLMCLHFSKLSIAIVLFDIFCRFHCIPGEPSKYFLAFPYAIYQLNKDMKMGGNLMNVAPSEEQFCGSLFIWLECIWHSQY